MRFGMLQSHLAHCSERVAMSAASLSYIRIKRAKQTIFLHCDLNAENIVVIKERVEKLTGVPLMKQRLYLGKQMLENMTTLWDCGIDKEDRELTLVYQRDDGSWEDPNDSLLDVKA